MAWVPPYETFGKDPDAWLTVAEAARECKCSPDYLRRQCRSGRCRYALPPGRQRGMRIRRRNLWTWLEESVVGREHGAGTVQEGAGR